MRRHKHVVNVSELDSEERLVGSRFGGASKQLGVATESRKLGCNYFEVPPGRALCPHHWHASNEEAIFIIEGQGTMRIGDEEVAVRTGDYITFPTGPEAAHQLNNTSDAPIRYLCISTKAATEVVGYPDSGKVGAICGPDGGERWLAEFFRGDSSVDYFDGEDVE